MAFPARPAAFAALLLAGVAGSAEAQFMDCMAKGYPDAFPEAPTASDMACVELFRFAFATPGGPRFMRGIADAAGDWAAPLPLSPTSSAARGCRPKPLARLGAMRSTTSPF